MQSNIIILIQGDLSTNQARLRSNIVEQLGIISLDVTVF